MFVWKNKSLQILLVFCFTGNYQVVCFPAVITSVTMGCVWRTPQGISSVTVTWAGPGSTAPRIVYVTTTVCVRAGLGSVTSASTTPRGNIVNSARPDITGTPQIRLVSFEKFE